MGAAHKILDKKTLQVLVPFNALSPMHFSEVAQKTAVDEVRAGRLVFKEGDRDNQSVYLLEGEISLVAGNEIVGSVTAGSDASRHPLAHQQPRQVTARAKTNVVVARVDSSLLDIMLTWDQSSGYEVSEIDDNDDDDWMTRILQSQSFLKLPPSNIQRLLMKVESVPVKAGEIIIRQGGEGDYFYIIKNGRCMVTRKPSVNAKEVKLAELADGDAFGEDALVSDAKRNATVTMMTDGVLMRLSKKDFVELLKEPLLNKLNYPEAAAKVAKGAVWLDVRLPGEFENVHIPESRNIPLSALRLEANGLDAARKYIVCCDTGRRSASAAFVLSQRGFEVYVLSDGFGGVPAEALAGQAATATANPAPNEPAAAAVVDLNPPTIAAVETQAPAVVDNEQLAALQGRLEGLQGEKQNLEAAQARLTGRVNDLQEELERVRDEAREQILELEQILADTRESAATAQAALQQLETASGTQEQAGSAAREQAQALEAELAERRAREDRLNTEHETLKARLAELESMRREEARQRADADTALAGLQAELEALQGQVQQADAHLARIKELEAALQAANDQGGQAHAEQLRRVDELEAALQVAAAALARAQQETERQQAELAAAHTRQLETAQADAAQQIKDLQGQLDTLEAVRSELETRFAAAGEELAQAQQSGQQTHAELQARIEALSGELERTAAHSVAQQALAEASARDLAALREAQGQTVAVAQGEAERLRAELAEAVAARAALTAERDDLQSRQDQVTHEQTELQAALAKARVRIDELQEDASGQVKRLEAAVDEARRQFQVAQAESDELRLAQTQSDHDRSELQAELAQASKRIEELGADTGQQVNQLEAALDAARQEHAAAQSEREQLQAELETLRPTLADLEARLATSEQAAAQDLEAHQADSASLHEQLAAANQAQAALAHERDAAQSELDGLRMRVQQLEQQQADAASGQNEQTRRLTELRDRLQVAECRAEEVAAARAEIEARLGEMTAAAHTAQATLEQSEQKHRQALAEAEQRVRAALEQQQRELVSELEGARAALAREQSQRGNLEQAAKTELASARSALEADLTQARATLETRQQALAEAVAARQSLEAELAGLNVETESQQQAMIAELEQLRLATSVDLEAMQKQVLHLKEELQAAHKLSAGGSADDELARLRLLLDQAREEANVARADAEQWREHALAEMQPPAQIESQSHQTSDELAAMRVQLADIQSRVDEAMQLRDSAQQEAVQLRHALQAQQLRESLGISEATGESGTSPVRRGGLWMGLAAGLLLGILGAGAALWYGREAPAPAATAVINSKAGTADAVAPRPEAAQAAPAVPTLAEDSQPAKPSAATRRTLHDALGDGSQGPRLVEVAAAGFTMGSGSSSLDLDERPRRDVQLRRFAIGQYEVTFDEYDAFARATGRALPDDKGWGRGQRPVVNVSWEEAVAYTQWLSEQTGQRYRLPAEAEWEYAAGGSVRSLYWWGNSPGEGRANCFNCDSEWDSRLSAPVGSFSPNPLGLYDTAGNVAEWVQDCYQPNYEGAPVDGSARITVGCTRRVVRGGGFNSPASTLRITKRDQQLASVRADDLGFRVVREF